MIRTESSAEMEWIQNEHVVEIECYLGIAKSERIKSIIG